MPHPSNNPPAPQSSPVDAALLQQAETLIERDPSASLSKTRIVLEKLLRAIAAHYQEEAAESKMLGQILADKALAQHIAPRVLIRMKSIKDLANLGAHSDQVYPQDACKAFDELSEIIEWA